MTTTSAVMSPVVSVSSDWTGTCLRASTSPPASVMAAATAVRMALLVLVAPLTVSTPRDWLSTMALGMRSRAGAAMLSVSDCSVTTTLVMALSLTVTSTVTGPLLPSAVPV